MLLKIKLEDWSTSKLCSSVICRLDLIGPRATCQWTIKWLMFFNVDKCKILHIGKDNPNFDYQMEDKDGNSTNLIVVNCEKDLRVYVQDNLKFDKHISLTVNRANRLVGLIKRAFSYLDEETLLVLYKTLIRPILDYGNLIWFPTLKKDIRAIENVQRRILSYQIFDTKND